MAENKEYGGSLVLCVPPYCTTKLFRYFFFSREEWSRFDFDQSSGNSPLIVPPRNLAWPLPFPVHLARCAISAPMPLSGDEWTSRTMSSRTPGAEHQRMDSHGALVDAYRRPASSAFWRSRIAASHAGLIPPCLTSMLNTSVPSAIHVLVFLGNDFENAFMPSPETRPLAASIVRLLSFWQTAPAQVARRGIAMLINLVSRRLRRLLRDRCGRCQQHAKDDGQAVHDGLDDFSPPTLADGRSGANCSWLS